MNKRKKVTIIAFVVCLAICVLCIAACGNGGTQSGGGGNDDPITPGHTTHSYTETVVDPTCTEQGYTLHKCACGEEYKDNYVNATGHTYEDYLCEVCYTIDPNAPYTEGLEYTEISDNGALIGYEVSKGTAGNNKWIKIPSECNGKPVTSIGGGAFSGCSGLESVTVQEGNTVYHSAGNCLIETASKELIAGCKNSVIPTDGSVTSIGGYAFYDCNSLTSITIPNSVTSIESDAFFGCSSLTSVVFAENSQLTSIGVYAFEYCSNLTSIEIPNGVTVIERYAFLDCNGLASIIIPNSVTSIGVYAFYGCTGLTSIVIPNSVTSIEKRAFDGCYSLTSIVIPNSVTSISVRAFGYCRSLTIYCEAASKPNGWDKNWHSNRPVVWGHKSSE